MDRREYLRKYYIENKERLQSKRKERYRRDPCYREELIKRARIRSILRNLNRTVRAVILMGLKPK